MTFTGRVPDEVVAEVLSTADLGLSPDPLNPLNDVSTMNKTMEYMAFELPVVAFDLKETRVSADDAAVYVRAQRRRGLRRRDRRRSSTIPTAGDGGEHGRERVEDVLAWHHQAPRYVGVYERLLGERKV